MTGVDHNPSPAKLRTFGVTILVGLPIVGLLLWYAPTIRWRLGWAGPPADGLGGPRVLAIMLVVVALVVFVLSVSAPRAARVVYVAWMTAGMTLGNIMTPVLFTVLFVILLPVFSLIRLKDPLRIRMGRCDSYWEAPSPHESSLERGKRPF